MVKSIDLTDQRFQKSPKRKQKSLDISQNK